MFIGPPAARGLAGGRRRPLPGSLGPGRGHQPCGISGGSGREARRSLIRSG